MPSPMTYRRLPLFFLTTLLSLAPFGVEVALAQDDPCIEILARNTAQIERYDAKVEDFLQATERQQPLEQIQALDELWALCDQNLRNRVLRADALDAAGRCAEAAELYLWVVAKAPHWPHPENGADALDRAQNALLSLGNRCIARLQLQCHTTNAILLIGEERYPCPTEISLPSGPRTITTTANGYHPLTANYDLIPGTNFIAIEALQPIERSGTVTFQCEGQGVEIMVGPERFTCPVTRTFPAGPLSFTAWRPQQQPFTDRIDIRENQSITVTIPASSDAPSGALTVNCKPAAVLTIRPIDVAREPLTIKCPTTIDLPPGAYKLSAIADEHLETERSTVVTAGATSVVNLPLDKPSPFHLHLKAGGGLSLGNAPNQSEKLPAASTGIVAGLDIAPQTRLAVSATFRASFGESESGSEESGGEGDSSTTKDDEIGATNLGLLAGMHYQFVFERFLYGMGVYYHIGSAWSAYGIGANLGLELGAGFGLTFDYIGFFLGGEERWVMDFIGGLSYAFF